MTTGRATETVPRQEARLLSRTRWRLVGLSAASTLIVLLVLGAVLYAVIARQLAADSEAQLRRRAETIAAIGPLRLSRLPIPDALVARRDTTADGGFPFDIMVAADAAAPGFLFGGPTSGTIAFILDAEGLPLGRPGTRVGTTPAASPLPDTFTVPLRGPVPDAVQAALRDGIATMRETEVLGVPVRAYTASLTGDQAAVVQVVADRTTELRTLQVTLLVLLVGGVAATLIAAGFGWVYAGRALVPIRESLRRQREFTADASHELRTPLTIMRGNVELLRTLELRGAAAGPADRQERTATLDEIDVGLDRITRLVDELLILARADADAVGFELVPTDLAEAAASAADSLASPAQRHGVTIGLDITPVTVAGDRERLEQLVVLLLDNAVRHAPQGGACRVTVARDGPVAILDVEDDGPGIRPGDEDRLFDRFWRAPHAPEGGSGLGLSIAAWIVEGHGGRITAENRDPRGARFRVTLPAAG